MRITACILYILAAVPVFAADNLVLVTIDGLRWQEVFRGVDKNLVEDEAFTSRRELLETRFPSGEGNGKVLLPFMHDTLAKSGVIYGNRDRNECMKVSNPWLFSYPGYNEILTGWADPGIDSNGKIANPNTTILEWLNRRDGYAGRVLAFGSWDVFPYIINEQRSGVPVNAGFRGAAQSGVQRLTATEVLLDRLIEDIPSPWDTVRLDAFTHHYAMTAIRERSPRVIYVAYGETDDFAHDGDYDQYILSANKTDRFLRELWDTLQSIESYRNKTNLIITTDHGRGEVPVGAWQHHASRKAVQGYMEDLDDAYRQGVIGSDDVWFAALGPDFRHRRLAPRGGECLRLDQVAATAMATLGFDWSKVNQRAGKPLPLTTKKEGNR